MNHRITPYIYGHNKGEIRFENTTANLCLYQDAALALRVFNTCEEFVEALFQCKEQVKKAFQKLHDSEAHEALSIELNGYLKLWLGLNTVSSVHALSGVELILRLDGSTPYIQAINPSNFNAKLTLLSNNATLNFIVELGKNRFELNKDIAKYNYLMTWRDMKQVGHQMSINSDLMGAVWCFIGEQSAGNSINRNILWCDVRASSCELFALQPVCVCPSNLAK